MHGVQLGRGAGVDPAYALGELGIVPIGKADHQFEDVIGNLPFLDQPQLLQPCQDAVERGHLRVGEANRGVGELGFRRRFRHGADGRLVVPRRLPCDCHALNH